jgi:hypothetical protein
MVKSQLMYSSRAYNAVGDVGVQTVKLGIRKPSIRKSFAARSSVKRMIRSELGLRAPRGWGWLTNPKKAAYNRVYNRTSVSFWSILRRLFK